MAKKNIKDYMDPINLTCDPERSVFFWDEKSPNKVKNVNKQVIKVGDYVYFDGGEGKVEGLIQVGAGPNDYYLAVFNNGKTKLNAKGCYLSKMDRFTANNGISIAILIALLIITSIYTIINLSL